MGSDYQLHYLSLNQHLKDALRYVIVRMGDQNFANKVGSSVSEVSDFLRTTNTPDNTTIARYLRPLGCDLKDSKVVAHQDGR